MHRMWIALVVAALALGLWGCGKKDDEASGGTPITVAGPGKTRPASGMADVADASAPRMRKSMMGETVGSGAGGLAHEAPDAGAKADQSQCMSNLKQLSLAVLMYVQDYDERFPRAGADWADLIEPYMKNRSLLKCPADLEEPSYQLNESLRGRSMSEVVFPSSAVLFFESDDGKTTVYRHNGGSVIALADGHVKWYKEGGEEALWWDIDEPYDAPPIPEEPIYDEHPTGPVAPGAPQAQQVSCQSNLKQIALGLMMYLQDYDERYPPDGVMWERVLMPYIKNRSILVCPADTAGPSYALNPKLRGRTLAELTHPGATIAFFESENGETVVYRHMGSADYAFADGHVKSYAEGTDAEKALMWDVGGQ